MNSKYIWISALTIILMVIGFVFMLNRHREILLGLQTQGHTWLTYKNPILGVSFEYPSDLVESVQANAEATSTLEFDLINHSQLGPNFGILINIQQTHEPNAASFLAKYYQVAPSLTTSTKVDGIPAIETLGTAYEYMTLYVVKNSRFYSFRLDTPPDVAEHIKSSIRF